MWGLLFSTILASAADSFNPFAITQQFVLQSMVKKPRDILYFIIPIGVVNMLIGFLAYYGFVNIISGFIDSFIKNHGQYILIAELILGIVFLIAVGVIFQNNRIGFLNSKIKSLEYAENGGGNEEEAVKRNIKSAAPAALVILGICVTISELATALPYFAFLTILFSYRLSVIQVILILIVYNTIYISPLLALYFIYIKAQDKFERLYCKIKARVSQLSDVLVPAVTGVVGVALIYHSITLLLKI